jgi:3-dehydroquinate dehydratase/shikimate dehydrogenase
VDIAELRVDCLEPDERILIRRFPEMAGLPVILTIRRSMDGGRYVGGEGSRITLLSKALAFADTDRRRNFAFVDLEEDLNVPSLEEAARTFGTRIIRSRHNTQAVEEDIPGKLRALARVGDEIVKLAMTPKSLEDVYRVYKAAAETRKMDKILLCMGDYGVNTRILAARMGSLLSYTTAKNESDSPAGAPGQLDPQEMAELYRFRSINEETPIYAVVGYPLKVTGSPRFFNTVFGLENVNAVYVPFPADSIHSFMRLAEELKIRGVSVTVPYKEAILSYLSSASKSVKAIGACNTIVASPQGWMGYNTDAPGFSDSLLEFMGRKNFFFRRITIVGAGGAARAVAAEIYRLKGKALILNRTSVKARDLAFPYHFAWAGLDDKGIAMMDRYSDIIIQTTPAGMHGGAEEDPLALYKFQGREVVMDVVYQPEKTSCLLRAEEAGCRILNGYDMLIRQARYQYGLYLKREFPVSLLSRVKF